MERVQLTERANGKMLRMVGRALPAESQEELDILHDDQDMAQQVYVHLRNGSRVWYKHIDERTREDSRARIDYEKTLVRWLKAWLGLVGEGRE